MAPFKPSPTLCETGPQSGLQIPLFQMACVAPGLCRSATGPHTSDTTPALPLLRKTREPAMSSTGGVPKKRHLEKTDPQVSVNGVSC